MSSRRRDEAYALALCDEVVGEASIREARFDWLRGDLSEKTGLRVKLPVDAYWPRLQLVVEFWERQHDEAVAIFDKPDVLTVSKVPRRKQRRLYDLRRAEVIPQQGLHLVIIKLSDLACSARGKLLHDRDADMPVIATTLRPYLSIH